MSTLPEPERAAFEAAVLKTICNPDDLERHATRGTYRNAETNLLWQGWRLALAWAAAPVPAIPQSPQEVIDFIGGNFDAHEYACPDGSPIPLEMQRFTLSVHDMQSAFRRHQYDMAARAVPVEPAMDVLRELLAVEDLELQAAKARARAARTIDEADYAAADKIHTEIAKRKPAAWAAARAVVSGAAQQEPEGDLSPALRTGTTTTGTQAARESALPGWKFIIKPDRAEISTPHNGRWTLWPDSPGAAGILFQLATALARHDEAATT